MGVEVKDSEEEKDLVEQALENNEGGEGNLRKAGIIGEETKGQIEKIGLERPITEENLEAGKNVPKEVIEHILKNNYNVKNPKFVRCVDDRTPEDSNYGIYAAGGTQGLIKNIISVLNKSYTEHDTNKIIRIIKEYIGEENYYTHSDNHNINKKGACGCGDMNLALNGENHVCSLNPENKKEFNKERVKAKEEGKMEVLEGPHNAKGVILIDIKDISIVPKGIDGGYFIYNQKNAQKLLKEFVSEINKKTNLDIDINKVLKELDQEILSTFGSLGGEAPHYRINLVNGKFKVESDGIVKDVIKNYYMGE